LQRRWRTHPSSAQRTAIALEGSPSETATISIRRVCALTAMQTSRNLCSEATKTATYFPLKQDSVETADLECGMSAQAEPSSSVWFSLVRTML
jgi:hypothetical protein